MVKYKPKYLKGNQIYKKIHIKKQESKIMKKNSKKLLLAGIVCALGLSLGSSTRAIYEKCLKENIYDATINGKLDVLKNSDVDIKQDGHIILSLAASKGKLDIVKWVINACPESVKQGGHDALDQASLNGHSDVVECLIKNGRLEVTGFAGNALPYAAGKGHLDTVICLINNGVNVNIDYNGWFALEEAAKGGHLDVIKWLLENTVINEKKQYIEHVLATAAFNRQWEVVIYLIELNTDINVLDPYQRTPLHIAAGCGRLDVVKYLVEHHANVNAVDMKGRTASTWAIQNDHFDIAKYLDECCRAKRREVE